MADSLLSLMFPLTAARQTLTKELDDSNEQKIFSYVNNFKQVNRSLIFFGEDSMTSLLFQACLSIALTKREVVYICRDQFKTLPLFVHGMPKPDAESLKLIKFKYFKNDADLIDYLSKLHTSSNLPCMIVVDSLQDYANYNQYESDIDRLRQSSLISAHLQSAIDFINQKSYCFLIVSSGFYDYLNFIKGYFDSYCYLRHHTKENSYQIIQAQNQTNLETEIYFKIQNASIYMDKYKAQEKLVEINEKVLREYFNKDTK